MDKVKTDALYSALEGHAQAAASGERVSGTAANRVGGAVNKFVEAKFKGTFVKLTIREERQLREDPDLQIHENPGHHSLCMMNPAEPERAACGRENKGEPNRNDCKSNCPFHAHTDKTIHEAREEIADLKAELADANPIMAARYAKRIGELESRVAQHDATAVPLITLLSPEVAASLNEEMPA